MSGDAANGRRPHDGEGPDDTPVDARPGPADDPAAYADIIEDLRLHQVELEVQLEELRRAEAQIAQLSDRYRQLFARAPVPLLTIDGDGLITRANAAAEALLTAGDGLDGKPLVLHVVAADHSRLRPLLRHRETTPLPASLTFRDRTGTRIPCDVTATSLVGTEGPEDQVLLSLVDRREHERLAAVLAEAERSVAIRQLTGGIAHDFNNLLTVIGGNLDLLEDEVTSEEGRGWLAAAQTASDRGGRLVGQLLAYARARTLAPERCELPELLDELRPLLDSAAGESVQVHVDLDADLPAVQVDPTHLQTALLNLVINSRDAGSRVVRITGTRTDTAAVAVTVNDDGRGMAAEVVERATTPFFTTKAGETSSGLGLAMVASFVEASGGTLDLRSTPEVGTEVCVRLPDAPAPVQRPAHTAATPRANSLTHREVLLVEDQAPVRAVTATLLRARGAEVTEVADAETALVEVAARHGADATRPPFDVVLSDIVLGPGMDGAELRRTLGAQPQAPAVVLVSGYITNTEHVLRKPYTTAQLVSTLHEAMATAPPGNGASRSGGTSGADPEQR